MTDIGYVNNQERLIKLRQLIFDIEEGLGKRKITLREEGLINSNQFNRISNLQTSLLNIAAKITNEILEEILSVMNPHGEKIKQVTKKAEKAIQNLEEVNRIINIVSVVVEIFSKVISGLPDSIPGLINNIEELINA